MVHPSSSKRASKRPARPSTASAVDHKPFLLPSRVPHSSSRLDTPRGTVPSDRHHGECHPGPLRENLESHQQHQSTDGIARSLSAPAENAAVSDVIMASASEDEPSEPTQYDWASFIGAYARGHWDPHKTPNPPRSSFASVRAPETPDTGVRAAARHLHLEFPVASLDPLDIVNPASLTASDGQAGPSPSAVAALTGQPLSSASPLTILPPAPPFDPLALAPNRSVLQLAPASSSSPSSHRIRNSVADIRSASTSPHPHSHLHLGLLAHTHPSVQSPPSPPPPPHATDVATAAATMRWAAARVNIAPLALPSPERELTDPFCGAIAVIPGAHSPEREPLKAAAGSGHVSSGLPGRKSRLGSFWEGTNDVGPQYPLSTIQGSPTTESPPQQQPASVSHPMLVPSSSDASTAASSLAFSSVTVTPPATLTNEILPATAPAVMHPRSEDSADTLLGDYFSSTHTLSPVPVPISPSLPHRVQPLSEAEAAQTSVPVSGPRASLIRQASSPLPFAAEHKPLAPSIYPVPLDIPSSAANHRSATLVATAGRRRRREDVVAEEISYVTRGYLTPPYPPDEVERRRALYQFNLWRTGPDANFDRIVHLTRLVFNTKTVLISLIDSDEQWSKSTSGTSPSTTCERNVSICAHTILQRGDEPMVVLDTHEDWRFAKNPAVQEAPYIRFYAGAPLRTQDGYNVGTLAIMDDVPRQEFSPRQRHTLKEFAAIALREMELWRDKIQLRIRDRIQKSMEQFTRECLEIDVQSDAEPDARPAPFAMELVYERAAKLVAKTLDVSDAIVMDVAHSEVIETVHEPGIVNVTAHSASAPDTPRTHQLTPDAGAKLYDTFFRYPDGRVCEGVVPGSLRPFIPSRIQYALSVPIFNIDKQPFAMICAYNSVEGEKRFLEGHELSYLRAIGVIILSAVLKRRMTLADKAKSLFISNISHELRTPLHGILAAAELLADTPLNHSQLSFLQTVQACGTSLVETVNHVLDFTKLSGNAKAGGVEHSIAPSKADLMQLIEEAVEGCWIGHRARTSAMNDSVIGSLYSPPRQDGQVNTRHVEIIVEIGDRPEGWILKFEKGGIRRVLMNIFGNSLKFTADGYIHVILRRVPSTPDMTPNQIKVELAVVDTGKGISQDFLKNQLFHPFSQENPLQTGTGLGLAIVSSIVQSQGVDGKVDVSSTENVGTEIKVTFNAEVAEDKAETIRTQELAHHKPCFVSLIGFDIRHRGVELLRRVVTHYLINWWGCEVAPMDNPGHIMIVNEELSPVFDALRRKDTSRPVIILSMNRGDEQLMHTVSSYERMGGFCRVLYKPIGPSRLRSTLKLCLNALQFSRRVSPGTSPSASLDSSTPPAVPASANGASNEQASTPTAVTRRYSEDKPGPLNSHRPSLGPRSITAHPVATWLDLQPSGTGDNVTGIGASVNPDSNSLVRARSMSSSQNVQSPTITIGTGATLLKSSVGTLGRRKNVRVLVVEDNNILRNLLVRWLQSKGYDFRDAVDGREGVQLYESDGNFDVVLLDMSMPVLDGVSATAEIRQFESSRPEISPARILALTGMSSLEDKRRAFDAGVDGYLVKPIAFKTLTEMFARLGIS